MNTVNRTAFLAMIAQSEIGAGLLAESDQGYNVLVGSTKERPQLFNSYADHPRVMVLLKPGLSSTAAGRYQILERYYDAYKEQLNLPDFSPDSQDSIALQMLHEVGALPEIDAGHIKSAVEKSASRWASLPPAQYNQRTNTLAFCLNAYEEAGGSVACQL